MHSTERKAFEEQITVMIGGFPGYFLTPERMESYWRGLAKMHLAMLVRVVDFVLSEQGPEKIPSVSTVWKISRDLRTTTRAPAPAEKLPPQDPFAAFANRRLLEFLKLNGAASRASLANIIAAKNQIAADYALVDSEETVGENEFTEALHKRWRALWQPQTRAEFEADRRQYLRQRHVTGTWPLEGVGIAA
jgi:hypothetical protein